MPNSSPSLIPDSLVTQLHEGWLWASISIIIAIIVSYYFYKKNTNDLNQAREHIEECIERRIHAENQEEPIACKKIDDDTKRLQNANSNYDRGLSKVARRDFNGAEIEFSAAIDQQLPMLSKYYFQRGNTRYFQKRFKDACIDYSKAIETDPKLAEAWYNKGNALDELGKHDEAIKTFDRAIEINPQYAKAWSNKGIVLGKQGKHDEAIKAFDRAIEINPKLAEAWYNKGTAFKALGRNIEADATFTKAKEMGV